MQYVEQTEKNHLQKNTRTAIETNKQNQKKQQQRIVISHHHHQLEVVSEYT